MRDCIIAVELGTKYNYGANQLASYLQHVQNASKNIIASTETTKLVHEYQNFVHKIATCS